MLRTVVSNSTALEVVLHSPVRNFDFSTILPAASCTTVDSSHFTFRVERGGEMTRLGWGDLHADTPWAREHSTVVTVSLGFSEFTITVSEEGPEK